MNIEKFEVQGGQGSGFGASYFPAFPLLLNCHLTGSLKKKKVTPSSTLVLFTGNVV